MVSLRKYFHLLLLLCIFINATGLFTDIMEPDGMLYAFIAKQMALKNDFINLYNNGNWLDKPHFPFWITALSFKLFGVNAFAYKFPAFLFWLMGVRFTFLLAEKLYNSDVAIVTVLIYMTALQSVIALFDVRAEHYLTALSIAAIYYLYKVNEVGKLKNIITAAVFSACTVMTKGPFILLTILAGFIILYILKKERRQLLNYKWYAYMAFTLVLILPEIYCLYVQFDMHPEKVIFGKTNVSGVKFFFWDSQFGRFFNTGPIKGEGDPFFFMHTMLWAFLPWSILFYTAVIKLFTARKIAFNKNEWITTGSAAITFILFSLSRFQLPHYIIILFPHFSMICANYLVKPEWKKEMRFIKICQQVLLILITTAVISLSFLYGLKEAVIITILAAAITTSSFLLLNNKGLFSIVKTGITFCIVLHLFLNLSFYPALLKYQAGVNAAKWLNKYYPSVKTGIYMNDSFSLKFYLNDKVDMLSNVDEMKNFLNQGGVVYTIATDLEKMERLGLKTEKINTFDNFHISMLTRGFLNKNTRTGEVEKMCIIKLLPH